MPNNILRGLVSDPIINEIELYVEKDKQKQAVNMIKEWTGDIEGVSCISQVEIDEDAESTTLLLAIIGDSIAFVFCFIGILNFVNIISTSILSRRHELALFESIGQSKKQSVKMLTSEGMIYAVISLILTCIFGGLLAYWLFMISFAYAFKAGIEASDLFVFPYPFVIMAAVIFAICIAVPQIVYRSVRRKSTIVERLREIE
jgi:putative ABC transport system permease protein